MIRERIERERTGEIVIMRRRLKAEIIRQDACSISTPTWHMTDSIAVGNVPFVERVKTLLGFRAKGREVIEGGKGFQLREEAGDYKALF
jgi:hypothetical protein